MLIIINLYIRQLIPDNPLNLLIFTENVKTQIQWPANSADLNLNNIELNQPPVKMETIQTFKPNLLGISVLSLLFGLYLQRCDPTETVAIRSMLFEVQSIVYNVKDSLIK